MTKSVYTIAMPDFVRMVEQTYDRVYHAVLMGAVQPKKYGKSRLFSQEQVEQLRAYFDHKDAKKKVEPVLTLNCRIEENKKPADCSRVLEIHNP